MLNKLFFFSLTTSLLNASCAWQLKLICIFFWKLVKFSDLCLLNKLSLLPVDCFILKWCDVICIVCNGLWKSKISSLGDNKVYSDLDPDPDPDLDPDPDHFFLWCSQDQRLKEISMQTPPSASPSSQSIGSANNNHITQTPELFTSSLSTNRYTQEK